MSEQQSADLDRIAELYTDSLRQHGAQPKGVGWGDDATHDLRFRKLTAVIEGPSEGLTVADLGCGYGALFDHLVRTGFNLQRYRGYEISEAMVHEARHRVQAPTAEFVIGREITEAADYAFASGIFNVRLDEDEAAWRTYVLETLRNMDHHANLGWAFNLLSSYVDYREPHLFYGDPLFFFDYCKKHFSSKVALLHDYPLYEWTMIVQH